MNQEITTARLLRNLTEIITENEFRQRIASGRSLTHYIGFEISGYVHIGHFISVFVIKDLVDLGVKCTVWLADWHTWINNKLDGTKETAARIGKGYFTEALKASFMAVGGDPTKLEFRLASEWYGKNALKYLELEKRIEKETTLARMQRGISIAGRNEGDEVSFATLTYPAMQVADVFFQGVDIAHAGMEQRKAHVIMRDVAEKVQPGKPKPIAIHHPLLSGLQKPPQWPLPPGVDKHAVISAMKMSKTKSDSAIWVHDTPEEIERKISKAFCPEKEINYNPILNWVKHLLFWNRTQPFTIEREKKHGGNVEFKTYEKLEDAYSTGKVHPADLKVTVAKELTNLLQPVRDHFTKPEILRAKEELDSVLGHH